MQGLFICLGAQRGHGGDQPFAHGWPRALGNQDLDHLRRNVRRGKTALQWVKPAGEKVLPDGLRHPAETGRGIHQGEAGDPVGIATIEVLDNHAAHRQPDQVGLVGFEPVQETAQVVGKIAKLERLRRVVAVEITSRVPGHRAKTTPKMGQLTRPVQSIAANAVQENNDRAAAFHIIGNRDRLLCPSCFGHGTLLGLFWFLHCFQSFNSEQVQARLQIPRRKVA